MYYSQLVEFTCIVSPEFHACISWHSHVDCQQGWHLLIQYASPQIWGPVQLHWEPAPCTIHPPAACTAAHMSQGRGGGLFDTRTENAHICDFGILCRDVIHDAHFAVSKPNDVAYAPHINSCCRALGGVKLCQVDVLHNKRDGPVKTSAHLF